MVVAARSRLPAAGRSHRAIPGTVKQAAFQWLAPQGWSMPASGWMDIVDRDHIKAADIIHRVSDDVHRARLGTLLAPLVAALILPPVLLLLGIGIA